MKHTKAERKFWGAIRKRNLEAIERTEGIAVFGNPTTRPFNIPEFLIPRNDDRETMFTNALNKITGYRFARKVHG